MLWKNIFFVLNWKKMSSYSEIPPTFLLQIRSGSVPMVYTLYSAIQMFSFTVIVEKSKMRTFRLCESSSSIPPHGLLRVAIFWCVLQCLLTCYLACLQEKNHTSVKCVTKPSRAETSWSFTWTSWSTSRRPTSLRWARGVSQSPVSNNIS